MAPRRRDASPSDFRTQNSFEMHLYGMSESGEVRAVAPSILIRTPEEPEDVVDPEQVEVVLHTVQPAAPPAEVFGDVHVPVVRWKLSW